MDIETLRSTLEQASVTSMADGTTRARTFVLYYGIPWVDECEAAFGELSRALGDENLRSVFLV